MHQGRFDAAKRLAYKPLEQSSLRLVTIEGVWGWYAAEELGEPPGLVRGGGSNKAGQRPLRV
jgi:hypothetical protein